MTEITEKEIGKIRKQVLERVQQENAENGKCGTKSKREVRNVRIQDLFNGSEQIYGLIYSELFDGQITCNKSNREFLFFPPAGHHWERDIEGVSLCKVEGVVLWLIELQSEIGRMISEATAEGDKNQLNRLHQLQKTILKNIKRLRTERGRETTVSWAATNDYHQLSITGDRLDRDPWLLGCNNCVIDLRTGEARPGRPKDFILFASPVDFLGIDEPCPVYDQFIRDITLEDLDLEQYLDRLFGYSITGVTKEHVFAVLSGVGQNGKTCLIEAIAHVMGPLAGVLQPELLLDQGRIRSSAGPSPDIMAMKGMRLVYASESDENRRFSPSMVKRLCGSDSLTGRNPHDRHPTTFTPTHKLFLLSNSKPRAPANDYAFWRRMSLIPFRSIFVDHEPQEERHKRIDRDMLSKLKSESSGILARLVRGCLKWQCAGGLRPPKVVRDATAAYQAEEDILGEFIDACCEVREGASETAKNLYDRFSEWWLENISNKVMSQKRFGSLLGQRFERVPDRHVWYRGIGLLHEIG